MGFSLVGKYMYQSQIGMVLEILPLPLPSFALPVWNTPHLCRTVLPRAAIIGGWHQKIVTIFLGSKEKNPSYYEKQDMNNYLDISEWFV